MKVQFTHYLHDDKESWYERVNDALDEAGFTSAETLVIAERSQMPFYEVTFKLELDTDTGEVTILESNL